MASHQNNGILSPLSSRYHDNISQEIVIVTEIKHTPNSLKTAVGNFFLE